MKEDVSKNERRRTYGEHLTPIQVFQEFILPEIKDKLYDYIWVDLFAGKGNLILPILELIPENERVDFFKKHIFLFDIQKELVKQSIQNAMRYGISREIAEQNIQKAIEDNFKALEDNGARNILPVNDKFVTPNGVEGLKTSGTLEFPVDEAKEKYVSGQFELLSFASENVMQQVMIYYLKDDVYLDQVVERVLASVELKSKEE